MTFESRPGRTNPTGDDRALTREQRAARVAAMGGENVMRRRDGSTVTIGTNGRSRETRWGQPAPRTQSGNGTNAAGADGGALDLLKAQAWCLGAKITS